MAGHQPSASAHCLHAFLEHRGAFTLHVSAHLRQCSKLKYTSWNHEYLSGSRNVIAQTKVHLHLAENDGKRFPLPFHYLTEFLTGELA